MLPLQNRLKKGNDFDKVFKEGRGFREGFLFLKIYKKDRGESRFGFVIGKKISKKAVVRNRIKRQLRAQTRKKIPLIKKNIDVVLVVNFNPKDLDFSEIGRVLDKAFKKAKIFK